MKYNLNDRIKIKITEYGWNNLNAINHKHLRDKTDKDGFTILSLWECMYIFGNLMLMGCPLVIETEFEILKD